MSVKERHPSYDVKRQAEFELMDAAASGESYIKAQGVKYLAMPSGYTAHADNGAAAYAAYKMRAQFPEILAPTIGAMAGLIHSKEIQIEKPDALAFLDERATKQGLSLEAFHRRITMALLKHGRYGVLVDAPEAGGDPFLCGYAGSTIINWDDDFFVLDDSGPVRDGFKWLHQDRHTVLQLVDGRYVQTEYTGNEAVDVTPSKLGGGAIERVPFVVGNARDVTPDILTPPLIGVARAALAMYQLSADYRHQLFFSGQETLFIINGDAPEVYGAGVVHALHGDKENMPDAKYVGPSCSGIDAHLVAINDNREAAIMAGAKLIQQEAGGNESGYSRKLRLSSENATLVTIARVSCEILEQSLRNVAMMQGLSDSEQDKIAVKPPTDLGDMSMTPQEAFALVQVWQSGAISQRTLYERLQEGGIADPERTFEDELAEPEGFADEFGSGDAAPVTTGEAG